MMRQAWRAAAILLIFLCAGAEARLRLPKSKPQYLRPARSYRASLTAALGALRGHGGLVTLQPQLRTLVIPDLHGRRDYLSRVLSSRDVKTGKSYIGLLRSKQIQVVVLGDAMHAESRAAARWRRADRSPDAAALRAEAAESLGTMKLILDLKTEHPTLFHYLKGNHDNILNQRRHGDWPVAKYAEKHGEGALLRGFLEARYGLSFVKRWAELESRLPLAAVGDGFVLSHAGPGWLVGRRAVQRRQAAAVESLTWTDLTADGARQDRLARRQLRELGVKDGFYLAAHRPARRVRRQGRFFQINSEGHMYYAVLEPGRLFEPGRDLHDAKR